MSKAVFGGLVVIAVAIALTFRLTGLDLRPMHHDEANQAVKFGTLLETGEYRYDRNDHHGPTLYYLTLPSAWIRGQLTLALLDERTLRVVPALFGVGLILLFSLLSAGLGRTAVATSSLLAALSPALTYYSRFYIQESLFIVFALVFLVALGRYVIRPHITSAICAGVFAGLAYATKETSVIVLTAAVAAAVIAWMWTTAPVQPRWFGFGGMRARLRGSSPGLARFGLLHVAAAVTAAALIAFVLYSSFFRYPSGLVESIRALRIYVDRGVGAGPYVQPWDYYLRLLSWSESSGLVWTEGVVLALALVGMMHAVRPTTNGFWPRLIGLYTLFTLASFSVIRYKTPWNLLPFYVGCVLMAGVGAAGLIAGARSRGRQGLVVVVLLAAACHLGVQGWRANSRYASDPRNPYVYAHTVPDFLRLVQRVTGIATLHPDREQMLVKVIAGPYEQWPLPWYLRRMTRVGYWTRAADAGTLDGVPVIIATPDNADALDTALGDRYVSEFYGLRPDVLLTVYVERSLWDRFLASQASSE